VAAFFIGQDAAELCVRTWCALDYPLAQKWGGRLERSGTLAMGMKHCDFRWHIDPARPEIQQNSKADT
jgi:ubiquinone biosynthesis protein